ncbi:hypothetical protein ACQ1ZK_13345, partial [Enterococcus faecium]
LAKTPSVTIQKRGLISLNRAAFALMGEPEAVELLYDRDEKIVGLRPVGEVSAHSYPLRPQSNKQDSGPLMVGGTAFTQYYGIDTTVSRRWVPTLVDGVLCVDLKVEGAVATSNRSSDKRRSADV